ncbi:hypothetical protein RUESEDTHA_00556 [Ruegeria sp. THAF57]|uniref:DUF1127 domain-containing protein n=1 Tax=unclassified Ruegeria TaxID=2625375 RepID=UPI001487A0DD|nr:MULTISPECIES: DUF1127 domain-containing protein [unclassified Ruegeria]CAD0183682.1 hypothetical protein RUESEDTHA_00556 [Ruegeria sp. THAF57]
MTQLTLASNCNPRSRFSVTSLWDALSLMRQRRALGQLDDRALEDIGITREQAQSEATRHIWDAPEFWQK